MKPFKHNGNNYWRDTNKNVYDPITEKIIGTWNIETKEIEFKKSSADDEEEEDEEEDEDEECEEECEEEEYET